MGREGVDRLKKQYRDLYGHAARGSQANSVAWLQSKINEKMKDRVGPRGPRGAKGPKGDKGEDGEDGEDGLSFLFAVQTESQSYDKAKSMRRGLGRIEVKLGGANSRASNLLTQAIAVNTKLTTLNRQLSGFGMQIQSVEVRYTTAKQDFKKAHKALQAEAVLPEAKRFVAVQLKKQDITRQRDMSAL
eukprot:SAG11_NODE_8236_length_1042_cov_16.932131_1_plen_187_part_10